MSNNNKENTLRGALTIGGLGIFTGAVVLVGTKIYNGESFANWLNKPDTTSEINIDVLNGEEITDETVEDLDTPIEEAVEQEEKEETKKDVKTIAREIVYGVNGINPWGNDPERTKNLKNAGYTDEEIREIAKEISNLIGKTNKPKSTTNNVNEEKNVKAVNEEKTVNNENTNNAPTNDGFVDHPEYGKVIDSKIEYIEINTDQYVISQETTTTGGDVKEVKEEVVEDKKVLPDGRIEENTNSLTKEEKTVTTEIKEETTTTEVEETTIPQEVINNGNGAAILEYYEEIIEENIVLPEGYSNEQLEESTAKTR